MSSSINPDSSSASRRYRSGAFVCALILIDLLAARALCRPSEFVGGPSFDPDGDGAGAPDNAPPNEEGDVEDVDDSYRDGEPGPEAIQNYYYDHQDHGVRDAEEGAANPLKLDGDFVSNHIPLNPDEGQDGNFPKVNEYPETDVKETSGNIQKTPVAPKYMVDLYHKFSTDRYIHPVTNIVRSFMNINEDTSELAPVHDNKTRVYILVFNITSISRDEDIYMAELRLYKLVEADRDQYHGVNRRVSVHEIVYDAELGNVSALVATKDLYGPHSGWETFPVTEAVKRWVYSGLASCAQILEIRIDSVAADEESVGIDFDMRQHNENEPLLVVFSNDHKKKRSETRELHEMITQELKLYDVFHEDPLDNEIDEEYYDYDYDFGHDFGPDFPDDYQLQKRDADAVARSRRVRSTRSAFGNWTMSKVRDRGGKKRIEDLYKRILELGDSDFRIESNDTIYLSRRSNKPNAKKRRRKGRRRFCRRRPLYVDFQDINWHTWIIAPRGYQAYQCSGRCDFPLSDHLTPTKHAIIQTLVHANYAGVRRRHKTEPACCVPTKLEPISILYIDDKGIVTYKYDYDDMVVTECGCR